MEEEEASKKHNGTLKRHMTSAKALDLVVITLIPSSQTIRWPISDIISDHGATIDNGVGTEY